MTRVSIAWTSMVAHQCRPLRISNWSHAVQNTVWCYNLAKFRKLCFIWTFDIHWPHSKPLLLPCVNSISELPFYYNFFYNTSFTHVHYFWLGPRKNRSKRRFLFNFFILCHISRHSMSPRSENPTFISVNIVTGISVGLWVELPFWATVNSSFFAILHRKPNHKIETFHTSVTSSIFLNTQIYIFLNTQIYIPIACATMDPILMMHVLLLFIGFLFLAGQSKPFFIWTIREDSGTDHGCAEEGG